MCTTLSTHPCTAWPPHRTPGFRALPLGRSRAHTATLARGLHAGGRGGARAGADSDTDVGAGPPKGLAFWGGRLRVAERPLCPRAARAVLPAGPVLRPDGLGPGSPGASGRLGGRDGASTRSHPGPPRPFPLVSNRAANAVDRSQRLATPPVAGCRQPARTHLVLVPAGLSILCRDLAAREPSAARAILACRHRIQFERGQTPAAIQPRRATRQAETARRRGQPNHATKGVRL
jgi:hypothetical protein